MPKGWFFIRGIQDGYRSIEEQMRGLDFHVSGRTVLDVGCAEGLIAQRMKQDGATLVHALEYNERLLRIGESLCGKEVAFFHHDVRKGLPSQLLPRYDVVLLLAILHKLDAPDAHLRMLAKRAAERVVIRLPLGSTGRIVGKHHPYGHCDVNAVMPACGFRLEREAPGPRRELVQHWVR